MPKNNSKLSLKDIVGKKIREQYFDGIVIGILIVVIFFTIYYLFDIENFAKNIVNIFILLVACIPFIILSILNRVCIGKVVCVLSEDKLYYFNAFTRIKSKNEKTNGFVKYSEIKNIEYVSSSPGIMAKTSQVIISGDDFNITICNANRSLVKRINKISKAM